MTGTSLPKAHLMAVTHFRATSADFAERAEAALSVLAARPGYVRGQLSRSTDDESDWVLVTEWENVGSYRRALGGMDAKLVAMPLLAEALDIPSSFETLAIGTPVARSSTATATGNPGCSAGYS